jgi:hypothetical protein
VAGLGWGIYKYVNQQKTESAATTRDDGAADTAAQQNKADSPAGLQTKAADSAFYRFIFETTANSHRAHNRYDSLKSWGEHVFIDSTGNDSNTIYHLFVKAKLTAGDTTLVKDSVQRYFQRPIKIVQN